MYRSKFIINVRRLSHAAFMKSSVIEVKYLQGNNSLLYYRYMPHTLYYISVIVMNYGPRQCLEGKRANNITGIVYAIVFMTAGNMISSTFLIIISLIKESIRIYSNQRRSQRRKGGRGRKNIKLFIKSNLI